MLEVEPDVDNAQHLSNWLTKKRAAVKLGAPELSYGTACHDNDLVTTFDFDLDTFRAAALCNKATPFLDDGCRWCCVLFAS